MKKIRVHIKSLTYYLVSLFFKTGRKYSCTSTKIGKILSILAFKYAYNGILLFDAEIKKYENCGTIIEDSCFWVYPDEYICGKAQNNKKYILDELKEPVDLPYNLYYRYEQLCQYDIPSYIKKDVEEVFRYFGAYSKEDLSEVLNPIVDMLTTECCGKIDLSKISDIIDEVAQDNEVIKYIKFNHISNEVTNNAQLLKNGKNKVKIKKLIF